MDGQTPASGYTIDPQNSPSQIKVAAMSEENHPANGRWYSGLLVTVFTLLIGYNIYRLMVVEGPWIWRQWLTVVATLAIAWLLWRELRGFVQSPGAPKDKQ